MRRRSYNTQRNLHSTAHLQSHRIHLRMKMCISLKMILIAHLMFKRRMEVATRRYLMTSFSVSKFLSLPPPLVKKCLPLFMFFLSFERLGGESEMN